MDDFLGSLPAFISQMDYKRPRDAHNSPLIALQYLPNAQSFFISPFIYSVYCCPTAGLSRNSARQLPFLELPIDLLLDTGAVVVYK